MESINDNMSEKQKAKTLRLAGYDYRQPGAYAITICTRKRRWLFQHPVLRAILYKEWENLPQHRSVKRGSHFVLWRPSCMDGNRCVFRRTGE